MVNIVSYIINLQDKFSPKLAGIQKTLGNFESSIFNVNSSILGLAGSLGAVTLGSKVIQATSDYEKFNAVLTNTFGSSTQAAESMKMIQDIATKTPFQVDALTASYIKLVNRGFKPTRDQIIALGDLASSQGKDFDMLTEAVLDAETFEFERLKEFGIKASKQGNKINLTFKGVSTTIDATAESVRNYVLGLGKMQGVAGGMEAISGTLGGRISNLEDSFTNLALTIGQAVTGDLKGLIDWAIEMISVYQPAIVAWFQKIGQGIKSFVGFVKENWDAIKGFLVTLGILIATLKVLNVVMLLLSANPISLIIIGIAAAVAGLVTLYKKVEVFRNGVDALWAAIKELAVNLWETLKPALLQIGETLVLVWQVLKPILGFIGKALWNSFINPIKWLIQGLAALLKWFKTSKIGQFIMDAIVMPFKNAIKAVEILFNLIKKGLALLGVEFDEVGSKEEKAQGNVLQKLPFARPTSGETADFLNAMNQTGAKAIETTNAIATPTVGGVTGGSKTAQSGISAVEKAAPRNFTINIDKLIEGFNINTGNLSESAAQVKQAVIRAMLDGLNDVSIQAEGL